MPNARRSPAAALAARRRLVQRLLDSWFGCSPYTNSIRFDDPELMVDPLRRQDWKNPGQHLKHVPSTGFRRSKHYDTDVLTRRVRPEVGKIQIEGEENAVFLSAHRPDRGIVAPASPSS